MAALDEGEAIPLLERSFSVAVEASLGLPAAERRRFIGHHLLAQLEGRQPPAGVTLEPSAPASEELRGLEELMTTVLNEAKGKPGWPLRAVVEVLLGDQEEHAPTSAPAEAPSSSSGGNPPSDLEAQEAAEAAAAAETEAEAAGA